MNQFLEVTIAITGKARIINASTIVDIVPSGELVTIYRNDGSELEVSDRYEHLRDMLMPEKTKEHFMRPSEARELLGISMENLYSKIRNGKIPAHRVGGNWKLLRSELYKYMQDKIANETSEYFVRKRKKEFGIK